MDPATIIYQEAFPIDPEESAYKVVDADIEILREYTLLSMLVAVLILLFLINTISNLVYYRSGPHGRLRAFIMDSEKKEKIT